MPAPEPFPDEEPSLPPGWTDEHIRTTPRHKNLFVHVLDPEFALMTDQFAWASDLSVHRICEPHYVDNGTRVINFTLQQASLHEWGGRRLSHDEPQHGIWVAVEDGYGSASGAAVAEPVDRNAESIFGPPKFSLRVFIKRPVRWVVRTPVVYYGRLLTHELSHVVGVPHHADRVENWRLVLGKLNVIPALSVFQRTGEPILLSSYEEADQAVEEADLGGLLVLPGTNCEERRRMYRDGQFVGCWAQAIARRGQQNSGDFECPMRYAGADYYEAPGSTAVYKWTAYAGGTGPGHMNVDAWEGNLLKYHNELDRWPAGKLCVRPRGTEINALAGDMNHNGDAGRDTPCREFVVVNDTAARGVR